MWKIWINGVMIFQSLYYNEAATLKKFLIEEGIKPNNISMKYEL